MKKLFLFIIVIVGGLIIWKKDDVSQFVIQKVLFKDTVQASEPNNYYKTENFMLFKNVNELKIDNKEDFNNFMYTVLNSGFDEFSFFCDFNYENCVEDFNTFIKTSDYLEVINNYINPFNSFNNLYIYSNNFNKITIKVEKLYTDEQISIVNEKIDQFIKNNITNNMTDRKKIKLFHDWIINNTKYDEDFSNINDKEQYPYHPYSAYGPLVEGRATCSGYTDAMAIFLNKIGIKNYKISSEHTTTIGHVWNYAFVDNKWYHIDLTWDDPITESDILIHDFFLISTKELENKNIDSHNFNKNYYLETKNS